jgi:hypothetical protein
LKSGVTASSSMMELLNAEIRKFREESYSKSETLRSQGARIGRRAPEVCAIGGSGSDNWAGLRCLQKELERAGRDVGKRKNAQQGVAGWFK